MLCRERHYLLLSGKLWKLQLPRSSGWKWTKMNLKSVTEKRGIKSQTCYTERTSTIFSISLILILAQSNNKVTIINTWNCFFLLTSVFRNEGNTWFPLNQYNTSKAKAKGAFPDSKGQGSCSAAAELRTIKRTAQESSSSAVRLLIIIIYGSQYCYQLLLMWFTLLRYGCIPDLKKRFPFLWTSKMSVPKQLQIQ